MGKEIRDRVLFYRLQNYSKSHSLCDVDDAVRFLRLHFPEYQRQKFGTLRKYILPTLISLQNDGKDSIRTPSKRCRKNNDSFEDDLLLRKEREHLKKRRSGNDSSEEDDGHGSTSGDFHFEDDEEEDPEPRFDLMKQILRSNYSNHRPPAATKNLFSPNSESKGVEKNIEEEVVRTERKIGVNSTPDGSRVETVIQGKNESKSEVDFRGKGVGPSPSFRDFGGMKDILNELLKDVIIPLLHPRLPEWYDVKPMTGILFHGPPGCGKTKLAHAIANETGLPFYKISATEVVSGVSGASEENIRDLFSKARRTAPSIVFIDEIDAIASKRENLQREMERRIVTQLLSCMDESHQTLGSTDLDSDLETYGKRSGHVLVIGATNRPDAVDPALRRPGRFDREIALGIPNESARVDILSMLTNDLRLEGEFDLQKIARITPGFVGADLVALVNTAKNLAMRKTIDQRESELCTESGCNENKEGWWRHPWLPDEMERHAVTMADFEEAAKKVQPSSRREGFSAIPNVKWEDVGGLDLLRKEFERYIVRRIKHPEDYEELGMDLDTGFLLYGPPGCGKTLIAKAVANEAGANFIHVKGPELLNKYVGESELAVRTTFNRARACSPCILFFDEVDALTTNRGKEGGWVVERLLNQLLLELDGADQRKGVFVIGATNRPEVMDSAVLRPGRFGKLLYVPLPGPSERASILKALARKKPLSPDVDLDSLARSEACTNLSGADLSALLDEAAMIAIEEKQMASDRHKDGNPCLIQASYLVRALKKITPSVLEEQRKFYKIKSSVFGSGVSSSAAN